MTKKEKILKAAEFDEIETDKAFDLRPRKEEKRYDHCFVDGARCRDNQLRPLITAMADRIEQLEAALGDISKAEVLGDPNNLCFPTYISEDHRADAARALGPCELDRLLEGELDGR